MPAAATKKASQSSGGESAKHTAAKPMAATSPPTRISRGGGQSRRRTKSWARISATPTAVRAMPATRAASAESRRSRSRAKKPTVICATVTLNIATKPTASGRREAAVADRQGGAAVRLATLLARQPAPERQQGDQGSAPVTSNGRTSP